MTENSITTTTPNVLPAHRQWRLRYETLDAAIPAGYAVAHLALTTDTGYAYETWAERHVDYWFIESPEALDEMIDSDPRYEGFVLQVSAKAPDADEAAPFDGWAYLGFEGEVDLIPIEVLVEKYGTADGTVRFVDIAEGAE